jgi:hypothetical protein
VLHFILRHLRAVQASEAFALLPLPLIDLIRRNLPQSTRRIGRQQLMQAGVAQNYVDNNGSACVIA